MPMTRNLLTISQAAAYLGVCPDTLRRADRAGVMRPSSCTPGGHRRYSIPDLDHHAQTSTTRTKPVRA